MSPSNNSLVPSKILQSNKTKLLELWLNSIEHNPEFRVINKQKLEKESASFLDAFSRVVQTEKIPKLKAKELKPLIEMLQELSKSRISLGYTPRETAMYMLSLKNCFTGLCKDIEHEKLEDFENLLDFLSLIAFENYSSAKEEQLERQRAEILYLRSADQYSAENLVAESKAMKHVFSIAKKVLNKSISVLLQGETGTGKEVLARFLHFQSEKREHPFVVVNCGAIPHDLLESELFGHAKGAFTGAIDHKVGKFELANGGTLFLDEIGEMPLDLQVKLLRVLQEKEFERVGGAETIKVDVRVISATNKDLQEEVKANRFRADLYYRLNGFLIEIPPLRERAKDILPLAFMVMQKASKEFGKEVADFSAEAVQALLSYQWPGNIRELENVINRAVILTEGKMILPEVLNLLPLGLAVGQWNTSAQANMAGGTPLDLQTAEKQFIESVLEQNEGNLTKTAKQLKISRTTLYKKLR